MPAGLAWNCSVFPPRQEGGMESVYKIAGIDVHKRMLAVVVANAQDRELEFECRKFGTTMSELRRFADWLSSRDARQFDIAYAPKAR